VRGAIILFALAHAAIARADPPDTAETARARQLAHLLGLEPQIDRILHATPPVTAADSIAHLNAIELAIIDLSRAALTVEATLSRLEHEELESKNAYDNLDTRHLDSVTRWNIGAVLVGNGFTIVGTGMQFGNDTVAKAGDWVSIGGSVLAAAFSVVALVKHDVGPLHLSIETNMLAPFLDRQPNAASRYADWIWRYLDSPLPGARGSVREQLLEKWARERRLPTGHKRADKRRLEVLAEPLRAATRVDADMLDDRADMLADVRERLAGLSVDLELLWREVHGRR
jgi:hypothetical protein